MNASIVDGSANTFFYVMILILRQLLLEIECYEALKEYPSYDNVPLPLLTNSYQ